MKKFQFSFILTILSTLLYGQISFQKIYGTAKGESCSSIQITRDSGFILAGSTEIDGNANDLYLIKTDNGGDTLWTKAYGGPGNEHAVYAEQTADKGYIIGGNKHITAADNDILVIKTDSDGNVIWSKQFGDNGNQLLMNIHQTMDGGYYVCGLNQNFGQSKMLLQKLDSLGNLIWAKSYFAGNIASNPFSGQPTSDGGYILTGMVFDTVGFMMPADIVLVKTDANGDTLWTKIFGGTNTEEPNSIKQTKDGGYIITGRTYSYGAGGTDVFLTKTDAKGDLLWTKIYGGTSFELGKDVIQTSDNGYLIAAWTETFGNGLNDYYLIKTDVNGDTLWTKVYGSTLGDFPYGVCQTGDGGYVVAGNSYGFGNNDNQIYLVKTVGLTNECYNSSTISSVNSVNMTISKFQLTVDTGGASSPAVVSTYHTDTKITTLCTNFGTEDISASKNSISIFPNPFSYSTSINAEVSLKNTHLILQNNIGQTVRKIENLQGHSATFFRENLQNGAYILLIMQNKQVVARKKMIISD